MKNLLYAMMPFVFLVLLGCAALIGTGPVEPTSTGFSLESPEKVLPLGVPRKVGVATFTGNNSINSQATDQFSSGIIGLGFEVIERHHMDAVISELGFQQTGLVSNENTQAVGKQLGVEAIFVGSVTGESSSFWVDTHLNIKLVDIETGRILWSATSSDPRTFASSMNIRQSIGHTVKQALELLEKDIKMAR